MPDLPTTSEPLPSATSEPRFTKLQRGLHQLRYPLALSLSTTVVTFVFALCGFMTFEVNAAFPEAFGIWKRWDAVHYLAIAEHGYTRDYLIAFLPAYPLAIRAAHLVIRDWHLAGLVLSNLCCAAAFAYFYLLARLDYSVRTAQRALLLLAFFPTAYFLHAAYTESLFLLLTIAAFYYARRGRWLVCGLLAMVATGTRVPGIAILPPLAVEYLQQRNFRWRDIRPNVLWLGLAPLGAVGYLLINYQRFGDPLHFLIEQRQVWGGFLRWPWPSVKANWYGIRHENPVERVIQYGAPFVAFLVATAAVVAAPFRLRPSYALYLVTTWIIVFFNNFPAASPRYLLAAFPLFILGAQVCRVRWLRESLLFVSVLFYAICTIQFVRGRWAF